MSDDIVTRLREHAEDEAMLGNDWLRDVMREAADEIERLRSYRNAAFVLKEGEVLVVTVPDWLTHLDLNGMIEGLPEYLRKRTVLLRGFEAVRSEQAV